MRFFFVKINQNVAISVVYLMLVEAADVNYLKIHNFTI